MRTFRAVFVVFALALLGVGFVAPAGANQLQNVSKKTTITTTRPLEVPGQVLPAGTYVFKVMDIVGTRNIMQITNADETQVLVTVIAVPDLRLKAGEHSVVEYKEAAAGQPNALRAWFYTGEKSGLEFVYPKERAVQIAAVTHEIVPAETAEPTPGTLRSVPLVAVTPQGTEEPIAKAIESTPAANAEPTEVAQALPKTASPIPLVALLGVAFVGIAFGLKRYAKQV